MLRQETMTGAVKPAAPPRTRNVVPWLVGLVVILALALAAAGAWYAAPMLSTTPGEALADGMIGAWNAHDATAARAYYTDDAIVMTSADVVPEARGLEEVGTLVQYGGMTIERTGPVTEQGNLAWWPIIVTTNYEPAGADAVAVMVLEDGKIAQHWVIWE